jgi:hypothetical protein
MKTTITSIFILLSFLGRSQNTDVMYVPDQKTLVASYNGISPIGFYAGGYFVTSFPQPYIYTTPLSIINRLGLNVIDQKSTISVMGGAFIETFPDSLGLKPDIWLKIYPLRMITRAKGFDFVFGVNYMDGFRYGVGISIGVRGIYR